MKIFYQGKEIGINNKIHTVEDMFRENIEFSPTKLLLANAIMK